MVSHGVGYKCPAQISAVHIADCTSKENQNSGAETAVIGCTTAVTYSTKPITYASWTTSDEDLPLMTQSHSGSSSKKTAITAGVQYVINAWKI